MVDSVSHSKHVSFGPNFFPVSLCLMLLDRSQIFAFCNNSYACSRVSCLTLREMLPKLSVCSDVQVR